jgi:hypothetical protein
VCAGGEVGNLLSFLKKNCAGGAASRCRLAFSAEDSTLLKTAVSGISYIEKVGGGSRASSRYFDDLTSVTASVLSASPVGHFSTAKVRCSVSAAAARVWHTHVQSQSSHWYHRRGFL